MSRIVKALLIIAGTISLALGILGIFLPLLPTTPFLLLTSACYVRSSDRLHDWLMSNKHLGGYIRNFKDKRGLTLKAKIITIAMLWASLGYSIYRVNNIYVGVAMVIMGCCTSTYLLRMKTLKLDE